VKNLAQNSFRTQLLVLGLLSWGLAQVLLACNVPAFRYALERWPADLYQVVVYCEKAPRGAEFELLRKSAAGRGGLANYSLKTVDVTKPEGKALAEQRKIAAYPWVEISSPVHSEVQGVVWSGPLTSPGVKRILESRTRSSLVQRLLSGEVAVWVLVRSGHEGKDRHALDALRTSLERASATLRIPEIGTDLNGDPIAVDDFKTYPVHFALMEIARDDSDEELLVSALLKSEPDLQQYDEPMAFPVFGRGRALYALVGDGIQNKNVLEACQSLINWCSCEIKAQNPGTDLLILADWSRPYGGEMVEDPELPLVGLSGFVPGQAAGTATPAPQADPSKPAAAACQVATAAVKDGPVAITAASHTPLWRNLVYLAGGAGLVLVVLSFLVTAIKKR
jgi:hypothetical protein